MMEGGEAAEQVVRMLFSGGEIALRLSGSFLKNTGALVLALAKQNKKVSGKTRLAKMLRQTRDIRRFEMTPEQYGRFHKKARKMKILYSVIRDKGDKNAPVDVLFPTSEIERANMVFGDIQFTPRQEQQREAGEREERSQKKESRSEPGSRDTSSTRSGRERTSERQSVERKLKDNKAKLERQRQRTPARERQRKKAKGKSK